MMTSSRGMTERSWSRWPAGLVGAAILVLASVAQAGPNLVTNGDLEQPSGRATPQVSRSENSVVFEFRDERNFGRVIVQCAGEGKDIAEQMVVGYSYVTTAGGRTRGLTISAKEVKANRPYDISIWFDLQGKIRPNTRYAYTVFPLPVGDNQGQGMLPRMEMIAPAIWADGKLLGATVALDWADEDEVTAEFAKRGVVKTPDFHDQTGGQALVLKLPESFKGDLFLVRVSLREFDEALLKAEKLRMPTPIRYVSVMDPIRQQIIETLTRTTDALRNLQNPDGYWGGGQGGNAAIATATAFTALGNRGETFASKQMRDGITWLTEQELTTVPAVAARLMFLAQYALPEHRQTAAADLMWLSSAQFDDGGWAEISAEGNEDRTIHPDNMNTLIACLALREAHYAGLSCDLRLWRDAARYWVDAQARDGGFREKKDSYGGLSEATTVNRTAAGLTGMLATLDMAFAAGGHRCDQYKVNTAQVQGIERAHEWLDDYYGEAYKQMSQLGLNTRIDPFMSAAVMQKAVEVSGIQRFNDKDAFRTEARQLLNTNQTWGQVAFFDYNTGLFAGDVMLTAQALELLSNGAAPVVVQRIIVGGTPDDETSRDADHLVRYLRSERRTPFNWRRTTIDADIEDLTSVPILFVHVVGPMEWTEKEWQKIRDYCFSGGVVVFNVDDDARTERGTVEKGISTAFPEYAIKPLPADDPVLSIKQTVKDLGELRVVGNGLKNFIYVPPQSWSCWFNLNQVKEHEPAFAFMDNLLEYTEDGQQPRSSFEDSPWSKGAATNIETNVVRMEVGADKPAWPNVVEALDRMMQGGYRLKVHQTAVDDVSARPSLLWVARAGDKPMTDEERQSIQAQLAGGAFLFAEALDGRPGWVEALMADMQKLGGEIRIRKLLANHPVLTGYIEETQGYDVRHVALRESLQDEYEKLPRADMYLIEQNGKEIGVLSAYDISSGVGYVLYPGCRGAMPEPSRKIMTNVLLYAMEKRAGL